MKVKVFGYRDVNMKDQETGRLIVGTSLYVGYPSQGVNGLETRKIFFNADMMHNNGLKPIIDGFINIEYGPNGRIMGASNINDK